MLALVFHMFGSEKALHFYFELIPFLSQLQCLYFKPRISMLYFSGSVVVAKCVLDIICKLVF